MRLPPMPRPAVLFALSSFAAWAHVGIAENSPPDFIAQQPFAARVLSATGRVSRLRDQQPWAISQGEQVPVCQTITTGPDGQARMEVRNGSSFDLFANSRVIFRENTANAGDLLDVMSGRVRVHLRPIWDQPLQRIFTPSAIITASKPATVSLAVDEDDTVRIDVIEGEVKVQHTLLPSNSPILIRAADSVLVHPNQRISYSAERGSLYRCIVKPIADLWAALNGNHDNASEVTSKLLASNFDTLKR